MLLSKKKKILLNLLLEEVDDEKMLIKHILGNKKKVFNMFRARKTEGVFNILIEKHLLRDDRNYTVQWYSRAYLCVQK